MEYYNLYKKGQQGWFHITSFKCDNLSDAVNYYKKQWNIKIGSDLYNYKVTGL